MEAVKGMRVIYKYRLLEEASKKAAWLLAFTTENETSTSVDSDSTATKDGPIRTPGAPEIEITATSIMAKGDKTYKTIRDAMLANKLFEIWEIDLDDPDSTAGKYAGIYYQGYCTECNRTVNAEDMAEISLTFGINGIGAEGSCTVSDEEITQSSYVFKDTTVESGS